MIAKFALFSLPIIAFFSNIFSVSSSFQGAFSIILLTLLFASLFDNKAPSRIKVDKIGKSVVAILLTYTSISASYVLIFDGNGDFKKLALLLMSFSACIWFLLASCFSQNDIEKNFHAFCKGALIVSAIYVLMIASVFAEGYTGRAWAEVSNNLLPKRNDVSIFFMVGLCGYFFLGFGLSPKQRLLACTIITSAILFSFSRSAYLAIAIITIYFAIGSKHKTTIICFASIFILSIFYAEDNPVLNRIQYTFKDGDYDDSTNARFFIWQLAMDLAEKYPIFGIGAGRAPLWGTSHYQLNSDSINFAHNYFITQLYQLGIVGLGLTILMFSTYFVLAKKLPEGEARFSVSILIIFIVMSFSGEPMYGYSKYIFIIMYSSIINKELATPLKTTPSTY